MPACASPITSFDSAYAFLSNFFPVPVQYDGLPYPTVEHAYQAAKTLDSAEREQIRAAATPGRAKRLDRRVRIRPDWEALSSAVMYDLLRQKFRDPANDLAAALLATGEAELIEGNHWGDTRWVAVQQDGE